MFIDQDDRELLLPSEERAVGCVVQSTRFPLLRTGKGILPVLSYKHFTPNGVKSVAIANCDRKGLSSLFAPARPRILCVRHSLIASACLPAVECLALNNNRRGAHRCKSSNTSSLPRRWHSRHLA